LFFDKNEKGGGYFLSFTERVLLKVKPRLSLEAIAYLPFVRKLFFYPGWLSS